MWLTSPLHPSRAVWSGLGHLTSLTHQYHLSSGDGKWKVDSVLEPEPTTSLLCVFGKPPVPSLHWSPKLMADWKSSFPPLLGLPPQEHDNLQSPRSTACPLLPARLDGGETSRRPLAAPTAQK